MSARRRVQRARHRRVTAPDQVVLRQLHVTGHRDHVRQVDAVLRRDPLMVGRGEMVSPDGPDLAGAQVVLVGAERDVLRVERRIRRAAATRLVVVEPCLDADDAHRAQRLAGQFLGETEPN
jgi:hypothetical protein